MAGMVVEETGCTDEIAQEIGDNCEQRRETETGFESCIPEIECYMMGKNSAGKNY